MKKILLLLSLALSLSACSPQEKEDVVINGDSKSQDIEIISDSNAKKDTLTPETEDDDAPSNRGAIIPNTSTLPDKFELVESPIFSFDQSISAYKLINFHSPLDELKSGDIFFQLKKKNTEPEQLFDEIDDWQDYVYCMKTSDCAEIIFSQRLKLKNYEAIKFTAQYQGRLFHGKEGFTHYYVYYVLSPQNEMYEFSTRATDLENPETVEKNFGTFMKTLKFI